MKIHLIYTEDKPTTFIRHKQISVVIEFFYNWDPQKIRKIFLLLFQNSAEELQRAGHSDGGIRGSEALRVEGDN